MSDLFCDRVLNSLRNAAAWPGVGGYAAVHLALFSALPTDTGGGTELTGGTYARVSVGGSLAAPSAATGGREVRNSANVTFNAPGALTTVVGGGLYSASVGGDLLWWGSAAAPFSFPTSTTRTFAPGDLRFILDTGVFTDHFADKVLNSLRNAAAWASANGYAAVHQSLFTVLPAADGTGGTEQSGGTYARASVGGSYGASAAKTGGGRRVVNTAQIAFNAGGSSVTVVGSGVHDAATSGNLLLRSALTASASHPTGVVRNFEIGDAEINAN